jgi:hypothetical protein
VTNTHKNTTNLHIPLVEEKPPTTGTRGKPHLSKGQDPYTPSHSFEAGNWEQFFHTVQVICSSTPPTPTQSDFIFEFTDEAAEHNSDLIQKVGHDLEQAISNHKRFTTLTMGSKLRPISKLDRLLSRHPAYKLFQWNSIHGIDITHPLNWTKKPELKTSLINWQPQIISP